MRKIQIDIRKGWKYIPGNEIFDKYAPVGAQIVAACPENNSAQSIQVSLYHTPAGSSAQIEAEKLANVIHCEAVLANCCGEDAWLVDFRSCGLACPNFFLPVEDCIMKIRLEGTFEQVDKNWMWLNKHLSWEETLSDNNGNPLQGKPCLFPPAMLAQEVSFTERDFWATQQTASFLALTSNYFDFIVAASLVPALTAEEVREKVEMDYIRHGGLHEIDYNTLSADNKEKLSQYTEVYIGTTKGESPLGKIVTYIVGIIDGTIQSEMVYEDNIDAAIEELLFYF